jgi:hypothetical protein
MNWTPTSELRWERRKYPLGKSTPTGIDWHDKRSCMVLQQKWKRENVEVVDIGFHGPLLIKNNYEYEWRDVPIVEEQ